MQIRDPLGFLIELFYDLDPDSDADQLMDQLFAIPVLRPLLSTPAATQHGIAGIILSHRSPRYQRFWYEHLCPAWNVRARNLNCASLTEKQ